MIGHPLYDYGDVVQFQVFTKDENDERKEYIKEGVIIIIDKYGTFFDDSDVSYDILVESENMLYKHFTESSVIKKVGHVDIYQENKK